MEEGDKTPLGLHDEMIKEKSNNMILSIKEKEKESMGSHHDDHHASSAVVVRSRWSPKPEQILILESIFNSGMVNPPKEETVRIRKHLEKFGSVGDANVFYWFQNRRSRSRRRHRQIISMQQQQHQQHHLIISPPSSLDNNDITIHDHDLHSNTSQCHNNMIYYNHHHHNLLPMMISGHQSTIEPTSSSSECPPPNFLFQSPGLMTVYINGVATEVPKGPIELKPMFGEDVVLVHSSGLPIPTNEFGILLQTLHPGESYFLVPRPSTLIK